MKWMAVFFLPLVALGQGYYQGFGDLSQPIYVSPVGMWNLKTSILQSDVSQTITVDPVLSRKTSSLNLNMDLSFRRSRRMAWKLLMDYKVSGSITSQSSSVSESTSSSGLKEPVAGVLLPFLLFKGHWYFQGLYSPSFGQRETQNNRRGGDLISLSTRAQWKHGRFRPFADFTYERFGKQTSNNKSVLYFKSRSQQMTFSGGVYGYINKEYSAQGTFSFVSVGGYTERSTDTVTKGPSYSWMKLELGGFYRWRAERSVGAFFVLSQFPDLDFTQFQILNSQATALRFNVNFLF